MPMKSALFLHFSTHFLYSNRIKRNIVAPLVDWYDVGFPSLKTGFDSRRAHQNLQRLRPIGLQILDLYCPKGAFKFAHNKSYFCAIDICQDMVGIFIWSDKPYAFFIQNKEVADGFKSYFNFLWSIAKE